METDPAGEQAKNIAPGDDLPARQRRHPGKAADAVAFESIPDAVPA